MGLCNIKSRRYLPHSLSINFAFLGPIPLIVSKLENNLYKIFGRINQCIKYKKNMNDLQTYVKKLIYKSNHRGSKEMDILLGKFASKYIDLFNEEELKLFEMILELDDRDIYQYALGKSEIPEKLQNRVMTLLKDSTLG